MRDTTQPQPTQESSADVVTEREVGKGVTRYEWSVAFSRMCMRTLPRKDRSVAIAAAMRIVEYLDKRGGQCIAKRKTIANELGVSERHLNRGLEILETHGWIARQRGGPTDIVTITLIIPVEGVDVHRFGSRKPDGLQDDIRSPKTDALTGQNSASYRTEVAPLQDTQSVPCNDQVYQKDQSAPKAARAAEYADRESVNGSAPPPSGAPAPSDKIQRLIRQAAHAYGITATSSQAEPLRSAIRDAVTFIPAGFVESHIVMAHSFPAFQASIASAKIAVAAPSS